MVEFDEEVSEAAILFLRAKEDLCTNKPDKATNVETWVGKPTKIPVYLIKMALGNTIYYFLLKHLETC